MAQGPGLGQEPFQTAGHAVSAQAAHHRGDPGQGQIRHADFRGPGGKAALPSAAADVDMGVHKAGEGQKAAPVQNPQAREPLRRAEVCLHSQNPAAPHEDVSPGEGRVSDHFN